MRACVRACVQIHVKWQMLTFQAMFVATLAASQHSDLYIDPYLWIMHVHVSQGKELRDTPYQVVGSHSSASPARKSSYCFESCSTTTSRCRFWCHLACLRDVNALAIFVLSDALELSWLGFALHVMSARYQPRRNRQQEECGCAYGETEFQFRQGDLIARTAPAGVFLTLSTCACSSLRHIS